MIFHQRTTGPMRVFAVLLAACMLLFALPTQALAAVSVDYVLQELEAPAAGFLRVNIYTGVLDGTNLSGDVTIPASIEGYPVTSIGSNAFYNRDCDGVTSVTIPNTVTSIGDNAFYRLSGLAAVTIPSSVKSIGANAFNACVSLRAAALPEGLESIGANAFRYCYGLRSVSLPSTLRSMGEYAFDNCLALNDLRVADGITALGEYGFSNCVNLKQLDLPDSVTQLGDYCFSGCTGLETVSLSAGLEEIPLGLFDGCSSLKQVIVPEGVESIKSLAFRNCGNLEKLSLPDSVKSIAGNAFTGAGDVTFYVNARSYAQAFAAANHIPFVLGTLDNPSDGPGNYPKTPFTDVADDYWGRKYIEWAYAKGYFNGTTSTTFSPGSYLNRAMLVTVLYRMEGSPDASLSSFTDVPSNAYYAKAAGWAEETGVVTGVGNGQFAPLSNITRQQLATMLYRYAQYKGMDTGARGDLSGFKDVEEISFSYAGDPMAWAVGVGIITGTGNAILKPRGYATRVQATAMLQRFESLGA